MPDLITPDETSNEHADWWANPTDANKMQLHRLGFIFQDETELSSCTTMLQGMAGFCLDEGTLWVYDGADWFQVGGRYNVHVPGVAVIEGNFPVFSDDTGTGLEDSGFGPSDYLPSGPVEVVTGIDAELTNTVNILDCADDSSHLVTMPEGSIMKIIQKADHVATLTLPPGFNFSDDNNSLTLGRGSVLCLSYYGDGGQTYWIDSFNLINQGE